MRKSVHWLPKFMLRMPILVSYRKIKKRIVKYRIIFIIIENISNFLGINRKIRYYMVDSANGQFSISPEDGIVTLSKPLDRETKDSYNISIKAIDQGAPQLYNVTSLRILVSDVNDNPPEFLTRYEISNISVKKKKN